MVRALPGQHSVADRIWANTGRVTGVILERDRESMLIDEGRTARRQAVLIPPHVMGQLRSGSRAWSRATWSTSSGWRAPRLLEALVPATSQPAYRAGEAPGTGAGTRPSPGSHRGIGRLARGRRPGG